MVKYQSNSIDATFAALADPTRRAILERLAERGSMTVADVAEPFDISLPAISKHIRVLEHAGLLTQTKDGRKRRCHFVPTPLDEAANWVTGYQKFWSAQFDSLESYLAQLQQGDDQPLSAKLKNESKENK